MGQPSRDRAQHIGEPLPLSFSPAPRQSSQVVDTLGSADSHFLIVQQQNPVSFPLLFSRKYALASGSPIKRKANITFDIEATLFDRTNTRDRACLAGRKGNERENLALCISLFHSANRLESRLSILGPGQMESPEWRENLSGKRDLDFTISPTRAVTSRDEP